MSIRTFLESRQIRFETLLHCPAPSATRRARRLHVSGHCVAKGILIKANKGDVLVVLPSTLWIDLGRLASVLGENEVRLATEDEVEAVFDDCERGAVPPFGRLYGLRTIVEDGLSRVGEVVFVANARHEGIRMQYRDYEALEDPVRAQVAMTHPPRRHRRSHRRAG
jgi:Ala-tRNA(Pro) deacylase